MYRPSGSGGHPIRAVDRTGYGIGGLKSRIGPLVTANGWAPEALVIDRESVVPIYRQLYERLREQILTGALPEGTRLPPERALAA